jgi:hypothetical protein
VSISCWLSLTVYIVCVCVFGLRAPNIRTMAYLMTQT